MIDVETLFEAVLNMSLGFASFINEPLSGKNQDYHSWDYSYQVLDNENFQIIRRQIKGIFQYVRDSFQMVSFCRLVEYDGCSCRQCYVRICLGMILTKLPILQAESQSKYTISDFRSCKDSYCCLLGYDTAYLATLGPMEYFISSQQCCSRLCYSVLNGKQLLTFERSYSMHLHSQAVQFSKRSVAKYLTVDMASHPRTR